MTDIVWGEPIPVNGKRPEWLDNAQRIEMHIDNGALTSCEARYVSKWSRVISIKLPADHFAYLAIAKGFEPWGGGDAAPADWDGGYCLQRSGHITHQSDWSHRPAPSDIIGYRKKAPAAEVEGDIVDHEAPQWAFERVAEYVNLDGSSYDAKGIADTSLGKAFAAYLADHEDPPVDPLVEAFDEIHGYQLSEGETWSQSIADRLRACLGKYGLEIREIG